VLDNLDDGVDVDDASHLLLRNNQAVDNDDAGFELGTSDGVIQGNRAKGNGDFGFNLLEVDNSLIEHNKAFGAGDGFRIDANSSGNLLNDNLARHASENGFDVQGPDNKLVSPDADHNGRGLVLLDTADDVQVIDGAFNDNNTDGILLSAPSGTLLKGLEANRNGDDGIDILGAEVTLRRDTANDHDDDGIVADGGSNVTNLGGLHAKGNGGQDCVNVNC
jgi:parallel beta-helix repeat protein